MDFMDRVAEDLSFSNPEFTPSEFRQLFKKCKVWQYKWGIIMAHDNDMHIHILSFYRKHVFLRKPLREVAFFMFEKYPVIKTAVGKDKPKALEFDLRMGWKLVNETPKQWELEMKKREFKYAV